MFITPDGGGGAPATPHPKPQPKPQANPAPSSGPAPTAGPPAASAHPTPSPSPGPAASPPAKGDDVAKSGGPSALSALHDIFDSNPGWSTMLGGAHAIYTAPNEKAEALEKAADTNGDLATQIGKITPDWWKNASPTQRAGAANTLLTDGKGSTAASDAAGAIDKANELPTKVANTIQDWSHGNVFQRTGASLADSPLGKWVRGNTVDKMPEGLGTQLSGDKSVLQNTSDTQTAAADAIKSSRPGLSALSTPLKSVGQRFDNVPGLKALDDIPVVKDIPVVGAGIAALSTAYDIGVDHENPTEAIAKEGTGLVASQAAYNATRDYAPKAAQAVGKLFGQGTADTVGSSAAEAGAGDAVAAGAGEAAAAAGGEAAADGILTGVAASGPEGWAVAAGVGAAVAVGYAATKFVEGGAHDFGDAVTQGGGKIVSGLWNGNLGETAQGVETAGKDIGKGFVDGGSAVVNGFKGIGKSVGSFVSSIF